MRSLAFELRSYTLGARGFLREEPQSGNKRCDEERRGEKTFSCLQQLIDLAAPIDLNLGQHLTMPPDWRNIIVYSDWLLLTYRCVVIGCLLINFVMLIDTYRSMIVRFTLPATRGFLSPLLSLCSFFAAKENLWDWG